MTNTTITNTDSIFIPTASYGQPSSDQWRDFTVIYGCVSVGNVPQLAIDLLVSTLTELLDCRLAGHLYSTALMPLVGPDAYRYGGQSLTTSAQVYVCVSRRLLIIQQRTPVYRELRKEFYDSLTKWLAACHVRHVLVLSSSFLEHLASALDSGDYYAIKCITNKSFKDTVGKNASAKWPTVERVDPFTLQPKPDGVMHLPGSGGLRDVLKWLDKQQIASTGLVIYCSEGDNRPHSFAFINAINQWLSLVDFQTFKSWITPFSWRQLFGDEPPVSIY
ncbi:proteasome assembly chaperone 2-like [Oppia nitens]|uniref:proteasome assembly chaperone 2-like n=1 Tax=Oppia nitens TaxID=1686743 RepID=UPI0023DBC143|nr:proteasome assembly chaperone 2-like [Oppia nitens]